MHDPAVSGNVTKRPMPPPCRTPHSTTDSSSTPAQNSTFTFSAFSFPGFPPPLHFFHLCDTIGEIIGTVAMILIMLCLPWLMIKQMHLLGKTGPALKAANEPIATVFGEHVAQSRVSAGDGESEEQRRKDPEKGIRAIERAQ